jgi:hypothetical protein
MTKTHAVQLSMFPEERLPNTSSDALSETSWSYSRRSTLNQCARRYYYEYFGAKKRVAEQEPLKEQLRFLKMLQNRHERTGKILHTAISTFLRKRREGVIWNEDRLVGWATTIFRKDIEYSKVHPDMDIPPLGQYPPVLLHEYHYRVSRADVLCEEAAIRMANALRSFCADGSHRQFREAGIKTGAEIERHFKLEGFPLEVEGVVDLAFPTVRGATIVDWKIGQDDGSGDNSLQLAVYALWAVGFFGCDPESLRVCKAHLTSGEIVDFRSDSAVLYAARARILQDAEIMQSVEGYGENAIVDAFTPCLKPFVCRDCSFLEVCPEGRTFIHD